MEMILQFFTQSNPLNNLNNITSSIPPLLQRQNSAPQQAQVVPRTTAQPSIPPTTSNVDIQRKYSLPMSTLATHQNPSTQPMHHQLIRKQSAPTIPSMAPSQPPPVPPHQTLHPKPPSQQQQQHQLLRDLSSINSPSRARDRNQFDQVSLIQDVQQLPLLKGGEKLLAIISNFALASSVSFVPFTQKKSENHN
jgi:hypothetical protein